MSSRVLSILVFFFGANAFAGYIVEPSLGVQGATGSTPFTYQYGSTVYKYNQQSLPVGLALKYKNSKDWVFGVMGEYYSNGYLTAQTTNQFAQDTFHRTIIRAIIGYEGAHGIRVFAGYDFMNNITNTPAASNPNDFTALNGTGYALGVGWKFMNHVAINAGYDIPSSTPSSITPAGGSTATFTGTTYNSFSTTGIWNINLSFPMGSDAK